MGTEIPAEVERRRAVIGKALGTEDGKALVRQLREDFVEVSLLGKDDRETVENVAKHDLVIYLIEMGGLKDV